MKPNVPRTAFTLTEVLVAVMIFSVISAAMLGVFNAATTLFQAGQRARSAGDEAKAILSRLERDCSLAVGPEAGGRFYAWVGEDGDCVVGWTIRRESGAYARAGYETSPRAFVLWGVIDDGELRRRVVDLRDYNDRNYPVVRVDTDSYHRFDPDHPHRFLRESTGDWTPPARIFSQSCWHFGVWLADVDVWRGGGQLMTATAPVEDPPTRWHLSITDTGVQVPTEPSGDSGPDGLRYYTDLEDWDLSTGPITPYYPSAMHVSLILGGSAASAQDGRLAAIDDSSLRVRGLPGLVVDRGSLLRVGDEWVGVHRADGDRLLINQDWSDGPLGLDANGAADTGRGALRSTRDTGHQPGTTRVRTGRLYSLTRQLRL